MKYLILLLLFVIPFQSCTTTRKMAYNQQTSGHYRLYTFPSPQAPYTYDTQRFVRLAFISSNDFEGMIEPTTFPIKNRFKEARAIKVGGVAAMRSYLDILKDEYKNSMVYVDAGSFLNKTENHKRTIFLYNYLNVDVTSLGVNEFSLESKTGTSLKDYFASLTSKANFKIVNSNLFDLRTAKQINWKNINEYTIKKVNGIKVGFLGLLTTELAQKIPDGKINGMYIQNPPKSIITKANLLRRKGAQVVVLMANKGLDCSSQLALEEKIPAAKVNFYPSRSKHCDTYNSELYKTLKQIPPNTLDLVITSGEKSKVANFINGYPVIQNPGEGNYLSRAELYYDLKHNTIDQAKTMIHQPVQLCHNFLKDSQDCYTGEDYDNQEVIPATFLGKDVLIKEIPN